MNYHIIVHTIIMLMNKKSNKLTTICLKSLSPVSTWECRSCHPQIIIFDEKQVETGSFDLHLHSTRHNQLHIATTYNEHLRPNFFYFVHLIITSYKLCFVNWMPPFLSVLTSNVCILLQNSQIMDTCLFNHRHGHLAFPSQLLKTFSLQRNVLFLQWTASVSRSHSLEIVERWAALENQTISKTIQN